MKTSANNWWSNRLAPLLLVLIAAVPLAAGFVYALLYSVGLAGWLGKGFTTLHWEAVLREGLLWSSIGYSLYLAVVVVVVAYGSATLLTLLMLRRGPTATESYFLFLPLGIPAIGAAFFFLQWWGGGGWLARWAYHAGMIDSPAAFPALIHDAGGLGIISAHVLLALPFFTLLLLQVSRQQRLADLLQVARALGATTLQGFRRVTLPLLWRQTWPQVVLYGLFVMGSYEVPLLLGRSHPEMLSVLVIRKLQRFSLTDIPQGMAIATAYVVLVVTALAVLFIFHRKSLRP